MWLKPCFPYTCVIMMNDKCSRFTFDKTTSGEADRYMQIVSFGTSGDRRYLYTVQKIGSKALATAI